MNVYTSLIAVLFLCLIFVPLRAQIPDNFEFLNHEVRGGRLGATKLFNDDLYFVNHNTFFINRYEVHPDPYFTTVYKVSGENEVEEILFIYCDSKSKIIENPDASFDIILFNLIESDFQTNDFISINVSSQEIQIDTFTTGELGIHFDEINKNDNGDWLVFNGRNYFHFNETKLIDTADYSNLIFYELISNVNQNLFGLRLDDNSENSIIYRLIDGATDSVAMMEGPTILENMHNDLSGNYLRSSDRLIQFSVDFSLIINEWSLDVFGGDITGINSYNGQVEVLVDQDRLYRLQSNGGIELISQDLNVPDETITYFQRLDDEQILIGGEHDFESITENVYFRNVNVVDNSNVIYPRVDVALEDVEVLTNSQDFTKRIKLNIANRGNEQVEVVDFYSRLYDPQAPINFRRFMDLIFNDLDVNESIAIDTTIFFGTDDMSFVIPGADYRFNANPYGYWIGDVMSSTADYDDDNSFTVFPNPCSNFIHIDTQDRIRSIGIYNELGQIVYFKSSQTKSLDDVITVSHLESGLYSLVVRYEGVNNVSTSKFVKE